MQPEWTAYSAVSSIGRLQYLQSPPQYLHAYERAVEIKRDGSNKRFLG